MAETEFCTIVARQTEQRDRLQNDTENMNEKKPRK